MILRSGWAGALTGLSLLGVGAGVDASAILDGARLSVFLTNRAASEAEVAIDVANRSIAGLEHAELLTGPSAETCNTFEEPNVVRSEPFEDVAIKGGGATTRLPPLSFLAMTLRLA